MPVSAATAKPLRAAVTVPGSATLEFTARGTGQGADVVVVYSILDGAAVRIVEGATQGAHAGRRATVVRHRVGFGWTENPTPLLFRVQGVVLEEGAPQTTLVWKVRVKSTNARAVMKAMAPLDTGEEGFIPLPEDVGTILEEVAVRQARQKTARKRAVAKKKTAARKAPARKAGARKTGAKKAAAKKAPARKRATKKVAARKRARA